MLNCPCSYWIMNVLSNMLPNYSTKWNGYRGFRNTLYDTEENPKCLGKNELEKERKRETEDVSPFQPPLQKILWSLLFSCNERNLSEVLGMSLSLRILIIFLSLMGLSLPQKKCQVQILYGLLIVFPFLSLIFCILRQGFCEQGSLCLFPSAPSDYLTGNFSVSFYVSHLGKPEISF